MPEPSVAHDCESKRNLVAVTRVYQFRQPGRQPAPAIETLPITKLLEKAQ